jgi:hypothetical protein
LIVCFDDLTIGDGGVLKCPTTMCWNLYMFLGHSEYVC